MLDDMEEQFINTGNLSQILHEIISTNGHRRQFCLTFDDGKSATRLTMRLISTYDIIYEICFTKSDSNSAQSMVPSY